jgi:hypothetical protein
LERKIGKWLLFRTASSDFPELVPAHACFQDSLSPLFRRTKRALLIITYSRSRRNTSSCMTKNAALLASFRSSDASSLSSVVSPRTPRPGEIRARLSTSRCRIPRSDPTGAEDIIMRITIENFASRNMGKGSGASSTPRSFLLRPPSPTSASPVWPPRTR